MNIYKRKSPLFRSVLLLFIIMILAASLPASDFSSAFANSGTDYRAIYYSKNVYREITNRLNELHEENLEFTEFFNAGRTLDGRSIPVFKVGNGRRRILIDAEHHSREYITSILTLNQIEYLINAYKNNQNVDGYKIRNVLDTISIWFIPMVNPDGLELCTRGYYGINSPELRSTLPYKSSWSYLKDNAQGVNLNRNYDTEWGKSSLNTRTPFSSRYPGSKAFSELETKAFKNLCQQYAFDMNITYHAAGEIIYWYYNQQGYNINRDKSIAGILSSTTGYSLISQYQSAVDPERGGGSREWFVNTFKRPAFTLEVGKGSIQAPLNFNEYTSIWQQNKMVPVLAAAAALRLVPRSNDSSYKMILNGLLLEPDKTKPVKDSEGLWLPLRQVSEGLGLKVGWDSASKGIIVEGSGYRAVFNQNSRIATVNGRALAMPNPVKAINGSSYISTRGLEWSAGLYIITEGTTGNIYIDGSCQPVFTQENSLDTLFPPVLPEAEIKKDTTLVDSIKAAETENAETYKTSADSGTEAGLKQDVKAGAEKAPGQGTEAASSLIIKAGTVVKIVDQDRNLYRITTENGRKGWVDENNLSLIFPTNKTDAPNVSPEELTALASLKKLDTRGNMAVLFDLARSRAVIYNKKGFLWEPLRFITCSAGEPGITREAPSLSFPLSRETEFLYNLQDCSKATYPVRLSGENARWFIDNIPEGTRIYVN